MEPELPYINLDLAGEHYEATPLNATLYTFAGRTILENGDSFENSTRNHIFLVTRVGEEGTITGNFIFEKSVIQKMGAVMLREGFPCSINRRSIPECDENAFQTYAEQQGEEVEDFIPEGWDGE